MPTVCGRADHLGDCLESQAAYSCGLYWQRRGKPHTHTGHINTASQTTCDIWKLIQSQLNDMSSVITGTHATATVEVGCNHFTAPEEMYWESHFCLTMLVYKFSAKKYISCFIHTELQCTKILVSERAELNVVICHFIQRQIFAGSWFDLIALIAVILTTKQNERKYAIIRSV